MRMKSVLALSALSAATFLASVAYAADAKTAKQTTASKPATVKVQDQAAQDAATPAPAADQTAPDGAAVKKAGHKKHAKHKHHKKHHRHGHRGHHHARGQHHHDHFHDHYHGGYIYEDIPSWNFLAGGSLGYAVQKENFTTRFVSSALLPGLLPPFVYRDHSEKITEQGVMMSLLGGWQWHCKRWILGAEANVDFNSYEKVRFFSHTDEYTPQAYTGSVLYDRGDIYAITGRAGYFVTPFFMPYIRLGAQMSRDEVSYQVAVNTPIGPALDFSSRKKDVYGFVTGIGAEFPTYIGASTIRFEYNFTKTESVIIEDNFLPVVGNHKFRYPETHIGKIAWVWNFM